MQLRFVQFASYFEHLLNFRFCNSFNIFWELSSQSSAFLFCQYMIIFSCIGPTPFWNTKFQDVNEKSMSHLFVPKSQKSWGKSGGQKINLVNLSTFKFKDPFPRCVNANG